MDEEVRSFRDKVGITMMSLGMGFTILCVMIFVSWLFMPTGTAFPARPVYVLVDTGIVLILLSFFTVKK